MINMGRRATVCSGTAGACSNSRSLLDYDFATDRLSRYALSAIVDLQ